MSPQAFLQCNAVTGAHCGAMYIVLHTLALQQITLIKSNLRASMVRQALTRSLRAHEARGVVTSCHARERGGSGRVRETYCRQEKVREKLDVVL